MSSENGDIDGSSEDQVLVAEYMLGLLPADEHARMGRRIASDPELRREAQMWRARLSAFDAEFEPTPPPAGTLAAIEGRLFSASRPEARPNLWNSLAFWRGLAGAAAAVAIVAVGFNVLRPQPLGPQEFATQLVAALEEEGSDMSFIALFDARSGEVRLTALSGHAVPEKDLELWVIEGGNAPVSMGIVKASGHSRVPVSHDMAGHLGEGMVFAITLEPQGGSPTGGPTGPVVAKGAATPI